MEMHLLPVGALMKMYLLPVGVMLMNLRSPSSPPLGLGTTTTSAPSLPPNCHAQEALPAAAGDDAVLRAADVPRLV